MLCRYWVGNNFQIKMSLKQCFCPHKHPSCPINRKGTHLKLLKTFIIVNHFLLKTLKLSSLYIFFSIIEVRSICERGKEERASKTQRITLSKRRKSCGKVRSIVNIWGQIYCLNVPASKLTTNLVKKSKNVFMSQGHLKFFWKVEENLGMQKCQIPSSLYLGK